MLQRAQVNSKTKVTAERKRPVISKRDWAHVVDVNQELANFRELVPVMAKEVSQCVIYDPLGHARS